MRRFNWSKIITMAFVLALNLAAAAGAFGLTVYISISVNLAILDSGDYSLTITDKQQALSRASIASLVVLGLAGGSAALGNLVVCNALAANWRTAKQWTLYLNAYSPTSSVWCVFCELRSPYATARSTHTQQGL
jgi:hypothetical protein